jgi:hypothetical protein
MSAMKQPEWDLDELKERIREQAASMRERVPTTLPLSAHGLSARAFNWLEVKARLKIGAGWAKMGELPLLPRFHGLRRRLALFAARGVLYLTRFLTGRQSEFNVCLLDALREMGEALYTVETHLMQQQEQIRQLEATVGLLQMRVGGNPAPRLVEVERKAS